MIYRMILYIYINIVSEGSEDETHDAYVQSTVVNNTARGNALASRG